MTIVSEVKVFEYIEATDSFAVEVNGDLREISSSAFAEAFEEMNKNIASDFSQPQTCENYCLAMIYEMHFKEEPTDLCFTFYRVKH